MEPSAVDELVGRLMPHACEFLEFPDPCEVLWHRDHGYGGPDPIPFQPKAGDKMNIRVILAEVAAKLPSGWETEVSERLVAQRAMLYYFVPTYNPSI